ncbi:MAG TPA: winged helix-turn-helix domain-containing protein [Elusimicrobiota bacterium]|nr:winged helix-turn-helix domain-containing protein [Elusimicrobiota bacterium]
MIAISQDENWLARLSAAAARGGWEFHAAGASAGLPDHARALVVLDRAAARGALAKSVAALRGHFPSSRIALACSDAELGADGIAAGLASGADEVIAKSWPDERLFARLSALRDSAEQEKSLMSADGLLKADHRSRRVHVLQRKSWKELPVAAPDFAFLWALLAVEGEAVSRERLLGAVREASGREVEAETVSRRALSLRRALAPWKGKIETVRGGSYRLVSSARRRSTT